MSVSASIGVRLPYFFSIAQGERDSSKYRERRVKRKREIKNERENNKERKLMHKSEEENW